MLRRSGKMAAALLQVCGFHRGLLAVRAPLVRPLVPGLVPAQVRTFSLTRDPNPELEENPFYSKYQEKISKLRSSKPQEFVRRMERRQDVQKEPLGHSTQEEFVKLVEQMENQDKTPGGDRTHRGFTRDKTLDSILNLELIQDKTGEEVAELWMKYYSTKDTISAVIPTQTFGLMFSRSQSCPTFLFALPQKEGYEFFLGQWVGNQLHFTSLINIQTMGKMAPSQLVLYHYTELQDRGVVLMMAEMDPTFISVHKAQCLANQVQLFYGSQQQQLLQLVETFNHRPSHFSHMELIAALEQSGLGGGEGGRDQTPSL